ncbi:P-loop containing nucleoside triphosphate hydrolase protein [Flagelloscypha sp. PMI_526]|nr:P-loop containing nucleoside triphosphate hydrolase protein [Flagelloscypha sp. PMI_526]
MQDKKDSEPASKEDSSLDVKGDDVKSTTKKPEDDPLRFLKLGPYDVWTKKKKPSNFSFSLSKSELWKTTTQTSSLVLRVFKDVFMEASPFWGTVYVLSKLWTSVDYTIALYVSAEFMTVIEHSIHSGTVDSNRLVRAGAMRLGLSFLLSFVEWTLTWNSIYWTDCVKSHYDARIIRARLEKQVETSDDAGDEVSSDGLLKSINNLLDFIAKIFGAISQCFFLLYSIQYNGGVLFVVLSLLWPIWHPLTSDWLFHRPFFSRVNNKDFLRKVEMEKMASFKEDVLPGNMKDYILEEHSAARTRLAGVNVTTPVYTLYSLKAHPFNAIMVRLVMDVPMYYVCLQLLLSPSKVSFSSTAVLGQVTSTLQVTFSDVLTKWTNAAQAIRSLKDAYEMFDRTATIQEDKIPYPPADLPPEQSGMSITLQNVNFKYAQSTKSSNNLKDVSFTLKSGSLVILVGANGSGKSTLLKLLSRSNKADSGDVYVDGHPIGDYINHEFLRSVLVLSQDFRIFPLSLRENIGLGDCKSVNDMARIKDAAKKGGALEFIEKLETQFETTLDPVEDGMVYTNDVSSDPDDSLRKKKKELTKTSNISGGERQRLVASRAFMRLASNTVRLCLVDEPTSAVDAVGEAQLFEQLRLAKGDATMILVSHRFGHLTRYADTIICLKDGEVAEIGTHDELILRPEGEYLKLWKSQADSFSENATDKKEGNEDLTAHENAAEDEQH